MNKIHILQLSVVFFLSIMLTTGCDLLKSDNSSNEINRELPRELSSQESMVAEGSNDFAFRLIQKLQEKEGSKSFFVSPLSITTAFGMALNGADGETYNEIRDFFGYEGLQINEINRANRDLTELLIGLDSKVALNIANSVWIREGVDIKEPFLNNNREFFDAKVEAIDFTSSESADIINNWVSDKTRGLIENIVNSSSLTDLYTLLVNAIYFKADWTIPFDPSDTEDGEFITPDNSTVTVPLMKNEDNFRIYSDEQWTVLDLWYGRSSFSFTAMVPSDEHSLQELTSELTEERFASMTNSLREQKTVIFIPKFELEYEIEKFIDDLREMGLTLPFNRTSADFKNITETRDDLYISLLKHKASINLDEKGTEASAATAIGIGPTSLPPTIRLDRPFHFFIRENNTNTILFMGSYTGLE